MSKDGTYTLETSVLADITRDRDGERIVDELNEDGVNASVKPECFAWLILRK